MDLLNGKSALITGAASGIGRATAERLAQDGVNVMLVDIDEAALRVAAAEVGGSFAVADVSRWQQVQAAVNETIDAFGRLDIVHLNAGIGDRDVDLAKITPQALQRIWGINVGGVVMGTRAAVPAMGHGGAIVATASLAGLVPYPDDPLYALTKHAVVGFVRSAADQLAHRDITINAICPGFVRTPMLQDAVQAFDDAGFPLLDPTDVADAIVQIVASRHTGEIFVCQPGRTCERYRFRGVPGPRATGPPGMEPPDTLA